MKRIHAPVLALLALLQFPASAFHVMTGLGQRIDQMAERAGDLRPPETPAGYAFSIWFVIFLLAAAYGLYAATKGRGDALVRKTALPAAAVFLCSSLWMLTAQLWGNGWHLVFLIVVMWVFSFKGLLALLADAWTLSPARKTILQPMFGLYTGWLTAAMLLNITGTVAHEFGTFGIAPNAYALLSLIPAALLGLGVVWRTKGEPWSFAAMLWAFAAVLVHNAFDTPPNEPLVMVSLGLGMILAAFFARQHAKPQ